MTLKDVEKISFSALGGILNLYSGISCVVIIEIFELVFMLIFRCNGPEKRNRVEAQPESTPGLLASYSHIHIQIFLTINL